MDFGKGTATYKYPSASEVTNVNHDIFIRVPKGLTIFDHQREAFIFVVLRENTYLALDPGLGKTIIAALICAEMGPPILYVTPPFLISNVIEEFRKWAPKLRVSVFRPNRPLDLENTDVLIIPDSMLNRKELFDLVLLHVRMFGERLATIFIDEAHRFNNDKSKRSRALFDGVADLYDKKVFLSGTPMPNRPIELFSILNYAAPAAIDHMNRFEYGKKFCGAYKGRFGWKFDGASNMKELGRRVIYPTGDFMMRIRKSALDLPPKIEELFIISKDMTPRLSEMDAKIGKEYGSVEDLIKASIVAAAGKDDLHMMSYRRLLAKEKVKPTAEYLEMLLSETDECLLVFALHTEATLALAEALKKYQPYVITGKTPSNKRQGLVNDFQSSGLQRRLFIGNIRAMGVGLTLTKATRVIFMEYDFVPGVNDQASDRAHRIGQRDTVYVQYVVYQNSLDKKVLEAILKKRASMRFI